MDIRKTEKPAEGRRDHAKAELDEKELSMVSGGRSSANLFSHCVTGKHISGGKLTC